MGQKLYYTKSHAHKPEKGKGSYQRGVEADYYIVDNVLDITDDFDLELASSMYRNLVKQDVVVNKDEITEELACFSEFLR